MLKDGRLASGSADCTIKIWSTETARLLRTLEGHKKGVEMLCELANGRLVSGSDDETLKIWNLSDAKCLQTIQLNSQVRALVVLFVLEILVVGLTNSEIHLFNLKNLSKEKTFKEHSQGIRALVSLNNQRLLASGSNDNTIKVWSVVGVMSSSSKFGTSQSTLKGHTAQVVALSVLPSESYLANNDHNDLLASASNDNTIKIWNISDSSLLKSLNTLHPSGMRSLVYLGHDFLASSSDDRTIKIWNLRTEKCEHILNGKCERLYSLTVLPNGYLVSPFSDVNGTIKIWNLNFTFE